MQKDIRASLVLNPLKFFKKMLEGGFYDDLDNNTYELLLMIAETQAEAWGEESKAYVVGEEDFIELINGFNSTIDETNVEHNELIRLNEFYLETIEVLLNKINILETNLSDTEDEVEEEIYNLDDVFDSNSYMPYIDMLVEDIEDWGVERGLDVCDSIMQSTKTLEEVIELQQALIAGDEDEVKDALGDVFITLVIIALQKGYDLGECIYDAYNIINKRKGKIVDGLYVKE